MNINEFCDRFVEVFDSAENMVLTPETYFKELNEYSSLTTLSIIAFVDENFDVELSGKEIREVQTMEDLYNLIQEKK